MLVSAPWPRSVGVKPPCPKFGKTARPTMRSRTRCPLTVTVTCSPTRRPIWRSVAVPSTISWSLRGWWPSSRVGDSSGPWPGVSPMAGTMRPPTLTMPWFPSVHPEMPVVLPSR